MKKPHLAPNYDKFPRPIYGYWNQEYRYLGLMTEIEDGFRVRDFFIGVDPPEDFLTVEEALLWVEIFIDRPHIFTIEDAISEIIDRFGEYEWLCDSTLDCPRVEQDDGGKHILVTVTSDYPVTDPIPRVIKRLGQKYFVLVHKEN